MKWSYRRKVFHLRGIFAPNREVAEMKLKDYIENYLDGANISDERVVLDENILTAAGMGAALDMGIKIVEIFCGEQKASALRSAVIAD